MSMLSIMHADFNSDIDLEVGQGRARSRRVYYFSKYRNQQWKLYKYVGRMLTLLSSIIHSSVTCICYGQKREESAYMHMSPVSRGPHEYPISVSWLGRRWEKVGSFIMLSKDVTCRGVAVTPVKKENWEFVAQIPHTLEPGTEDRVDVRKISINTSPTRTITIIQARREDLGF